MGMYVVLRLALKRMGREYPPHKIMSRHDKYEDADAARTYSFGEPWYDAVFHEEDARKMVNWNQRGEGDNR